MELALLVWFASISQTVGHAFSFVGFFASAVTVVGYGVWTVFAKSDKDFTKPPKKRYAIPLIMVSLTIWFIGLIMPDQKTVYMATGAYIGQKVVQSEAADKVIKILNNKLDEYLKEAEDKLKK